jgi:hypothetical protein
VISQKIEQLLLEWPHRPSRLRERFELPDYFLNLLMYTQCPRQRSRAR